MRKVDWHRMEGQSAVELALLLPVLLTLTMGVVDAGRLFGSWIAITNAAREGARYASMFTDSVTTTAIQDYTIAEATGSGFAALTRSEVTISTPSGWGNGKPVVVTIVYPVTLMTTRPFGTRSVNLRARTEMVQIRGE